MLDAILSYLTVRTSFSLSHSLSLTTQTLHHNNNSSKEIQRRLREQGGEECRGRASFRVVFINSTLNATKSDFFPVLLNHPILLEPWFPVLLAIRFRETSEGNTGCSGCLTYLRKWKTVFFLVSP